MKFRMLIILMTLFLCCAKKDDVQKVQFWAFGGMPNYMQWTKDMVTKFNAAHPDIKVIQSQKSWHMIRELLYTNYSAGTGPDVMRVHGNYAAEFGEGGYFLPINTFPDFEEVKRWYLPILFESTRYKDNYYGLPGPSIAFTLVCNKKLFDEAGLTSPKTWSQFREAAQKLTKDTNGDGIVDQHGLVLLGGEKGGFSYRLAAFMYKAGVNFLSDDLSNAIFNSPEAVATVKLFADMYQVDKSITPGFLAYTISEINDLFCSDKVAMSIEGPWFATSVNDKLPGKQFYTVPVPVPDDKIDQYDTAPTLQDMVMLSISANAKHPEAAWEFVKFMRGNEADIIWLKQEMGGFPTTLNALNSPESSDYTDFAVYRHELEHARPWPSHPKMIAIVRNIISIYGQKAIVGELSPQEAMDKAVVEAQNMIDENK
ncbi:sugar ABC transporter substrate-binding protein [candidate division KSB1 bacterium]|nr:sugar ABC transporter substrate-binding protein [candidate division KSB1 bacterium]